MHDLSSTGGDDAPGDSQLPDRLDSWKEIAAHFGRDTRTVRRWEQTEGLPVHRHLHRARGSVYAFPDELNRWWEGRSAHQPKPCPPPTPSTRAWVAPLVAGTLVLAALVLIFRGDAAAPADPGRSNARGSREVGAERSRRWPDDPRIREAFLVARHQLSRRSGDRQNARERLERVVEQAPAFADAHALLGEAYIRQALYDRPSGDEAWSKAEAAARRALALDQELAAAHTVVGRILLLRDWDWVSAREELARAIDLDPEDLEARSARALGFRATGQPEAAIAERQRVQQSDPLSPQWLVFLGDEYCLRGSTMRRREPTAGRWISSATTGTPC